LIGCPDALEEELFAGAEAYYDGSPLSPAIFRE